MTTLLMVCGLLALAIFAYAGGGGVAAGASVSAAPAPQQESAFERARRRRCSLGTMEGRHGYAYDGILMGAPIATAGPIQFDGYGNLSATYQVSI
ncbi:MAG: hypothetical protein ACKV2V_18470, partial [Blastocatellia bacterium]